MGNNKNGARQRIKQICQRRKVEEIDMYERGKLLLEIYRDVCWDTADCACDMKEEILDRAYCSEDIDSALIYLETFVPEDGKAKFSERVQTLFEVRTMIGIMDALNAKVREFPITGELYASIIATYYLSRFPLSEKEMLDEFSLDRSTYYRRKKEAVIVFGLSLWGSHIAIEELRQGLYLDETEQMTIYDV